MYSARGCTTSPTGPARAPRCSMLLNAMWPHTRALLQSPERCLSSGCQLFVYSIEFHVFLGTPPALFKAQCDYTESLFMRPGLR